MIELLFQEYCTIAGFLTASIEDCGARALAKRGD